MQIFGNGFRCFLILAVMLILTACAGAQKTTSAKEETGKTGAPDLQSATVESVQGSKPIEVAFKNVVFKELTTTDVIKNDYKEALDEFEASVISHLKGKNAFAKVERDVGTALKGDSLRVGMKIADMRIASFGARFWGGAFAGNSFMNVELDMVDAASGKTLRTETISSSNNAWGAAYSFGASDRSLPTDMGQIVAEYLYTVVPANK